MQTSLYIKQGLSKVIVTEKQAKEFENFVLQSITLPDHVGMPIGEANERKYVNLEMHYDNPSLIGKYTIGGRRCINS